MIFHIKLEWGYYPGTLSSQSSHYDSFEDWLIIDELYTASKIEMSCSDLTQLPQVQ